MTTTRLLSLDVFRGFTVAAMILVNNPGSWGEVYAPLLHARWHGCTPTDLIFPFFLFIVGISIHLSLQTKGGQGIARPLLAKIFKRSAIIFLLGIGMAWYTLPLGNMFDVERLATLRIPGVLQRISLVFLCCALLYLSTSWLLQLRLAAFILLAYYFLLTAVPVPGVGAASLDPETNLGAWLDRLLLGNHLWTQSKTWDPEGLLSTLPAIGTGMLGMLAGRMFSELKLPAERTAWLFLTGAFCIVLGLLWSLTFPFDKALWTSSYVLYTAGIAMQVWAACYWLIDVQGFSHWSRPFLYYGVNAIFVFVASGVLAKTLGRLAVGNGEGRTSLWNFLYQALYASWLPGKVASLLFACTLIALFYVILRWMYQKNIILKV